MLEVSHTCVPAACVPMYTPYFEPSRTVFVERLIQPEFTPVIPIPVPETQPFTAPEERAKFTFPPATLTPYPLGLELEQIHDPPPNTVPVDPSIRAAASPPCT